MIGGNVLVISDLQIPFHATGALDFCKRIQRTYRTSAVYCVGDEIDAYFGSLFDKDPDALLSPASELRASIEELKRWYSSFPQVKACHSNHVERWEKRAKKAGIPSDFLRPFREVIQAPTGWQWKRSWLVNASRPFLVEHGHEGSADSRQRAIDNGVSTANGHFHAKAGVHHIRTRGGHKLWGMNVGCLIDGEAFAFHYNAKDRFRPTLGCGVVLDGGRTLVFIPYD